MLRRPRRFQPAAAAALAIALCSTIARADDAAPTKQPRKPVKLPGILIDLEDHCVDLEATVRLQEGFLELVACTKGTKEHESIVAIEARPMHVHTALLLLGAVNGHPAMRKRVDAARTRWVNVPPRGDPIAVFLVTTNQDGKAVERPISDFIVRSKDRADEVDGVVITNPDANAKRDDDERERLPHTFLFAGSHLKENGAGPRQYLADGSGNVISIATFGDELLCLPFRQTSANDALMWRVKPDSLPAVGTRVTLRLRPPRKPSKASSNVPIRPKAGGR